MKLGYFTSRKIDKLAKKGNGFLENGEYEKAIEEYKKIIDALPEPKDEWDAYEWANVSIADTYYIMKDYKNCIIYMNKIIRYANNPFIFLRTGQAYYYEDDMEKAEEYLARALEKDGVNIFKEEESYFLDVAQKGFKKMKSKFKNMFRLPEQYQYLEKEYMELQILWTDKNWETIYEQYTSFFKKIPEEVYDNSMTYFCVTAILEAIINLRKIDAFPQWIKILEIVSESRMDKENILVWKGLYEFVKGNDEKAMEYFRYIDESGNLRMLKNFRHFKNKIYDFYVKHR